LLGLILVPAALLGQKGAVTGHVTDKATGRPLAGARIQSADQAGFAMSSQEGLYTLRGLTPGTTTLRIIALGYASTTRAVTVQRDQSVTVDWALDQVPFTLEELVTTATGEQFKRELGNNIGRIEAAQLVETAPTTNVTQVLTGRVAGVSVLQGGGTSGQGARIRIRGFNSVSLSNDPLVYIDGIRVASDAAPGIFWGGGRVSKLNDLNPEEIESIEVVKGPSAATLYGTQAANGVIRVTTKRGRAGAAQWNSWLEGGIINDTYHYPAEYFSKAVGSDAQCVPWQQSLGQCQIDKLYVLDLLNDPATTQFGTGYRNQAGMSVSGGSETLRYFISGESELETGPVKLADAELAYLQAERGTDDIPRSQRWPNHFNKYNVRLNLTANPRSNVDLALSSGFVVNNLRLPPQGDADVGLLQSGITGSADPQVFATTAGYGFGRPADIVGRQIFRKSDHFINSLTANWRPLSWLSSRGTFGLDYLTYADEQSDARGQGCTSCTVQGMVERDGVKRENRFFDTKYTVDLNATAQFKLTPTIGSKTAIGAQYNHDKVFGVLAQAGPMPPGIVSLSAGAQKLLTEGTTDIVTLGTYLEQQFSWRDRLFVSAAIRIDDNSAFGRDFRSAKYPKASVSWVALEGRDRGLSSLRFRAAYGASGQSPGPLDALTFYTPVTATTFGVPATPGVIIGGAGDPALKPERSRELEAGFDAGLFNNRMTVEVTFYDKRTKDALVQRQQPQSLGGVFSRLENVGVVSNRGLEVSVNARVLDTRNLAWDLQLEATGNRNRLVSLGPVPPIVGFGYKNIPGYPMFGLWWEGLTGFSDANGDGLIDPSEVTITDTLVYLGSTVPTRTLSANTALSLFGNRLRVGGQIDYRGGYVVHDVDNLFMCGFQANCGALNDATHYSLEEQAKAVAGAAAVGAYAEPGDHIRLREASITYNLPASVARSFRARNLSVNLTGRNLLLWKFGYTSWDPENTTSGSSDAAAYAFAVQPQPRYLILRINAGF
jgi:TonB-linked SusC/RagA family outer membrane protein